MNTINQMNQVVENEVKNTTNNNTNAEKMNNNIIDFPSVLGKKKVTNNAVVDQQVVNDLFNAFMSIPSSVEVKFKNDDGYLKMIVGMTHREKFYHGYETYADAKLVEAMIDSMGEGKIGCLKGYNANEHPLEVSEVDPRIDIFTQFINSPLKCYFENDFVTKNGNRYVCATFNISYHKQIKFCLKRTEEIESIINNAVNAA